MPKKIKQPTIDLYTLFCTAFEHFNAQLFTNTLPSVIITMQRQSKTMGYFSKNRWTDSTGKTFHEIAVNPAYFAGHKLVEVFQTIVHEQCHLWQEEFGTPSRRTYHNTEWANKMESIGLMPSTTGAPGGKKTGQNMADYPIFGGEFLKSCTVLVDKGFTLNWVDRFPAYVAPPPPTKPTNINILIAPNHDRHEDEVEPYVLEQEVDGPKEAASKLNTLLVDVIPNIVVPDANSQKETQKKNKVKYRCACNNNVWGKPDLKICCEVCEHSFVKVGNS